jgi:DNA repair protein RadC
MNNLSYQFRVAEVELCYKNKIKASDRPKVKSAQDAFDLLIETWNMNRLDLAEEFKILLLDRSHKCLGISSVAIGGVSACLVDPKIVFATALKSKASSIILCHNHPSGNLSPSPQDIELTRKIASGGKLLEISILDHLIVTSNGYYSMSNEGIFPTLS